ncbi:chorismate mutase [Fibrobacter sp. UWCM]|jgi:chorismate mutase|uniref:chorismate mutase n=1 Tax=Fibrobacter sp. UWCM TaxID=1896208 RepID=UPI0020C909E6|nr:chorismate mutase [Fibrobacter sp. UWCM]
MDSHMEIDDWRKRIDELTDTIISLLNRRAEFAMEIGKLKKEKGLPVFDAAREEAVLAAVAEKAVKAGGPLPPESIVNIFRTIMEETRKVEE